LGLEYRRRRSNERIMSWKHWRDKSPKEPAQITQKRKEILEYYLDRKILLSKMYIELLVDRNSVEFEWNQIQEVMKK